jgi:hypothetical protein
VLALAAVYFGDGFRRHYANFMSYEEPAAPASLEDIKLPGETRLNRTAAPESRFGFYAAAFFGTVVLLGLLVAHEVSQIMGRRAMKLLFNEEQTITDHAYERAEEEWANGNHLDAIRLMREYLADNPREQHVALRIAEIYEKDLHNHLAAALEYEEILQQKLSPERWGWAAIHLCNLYYRLNHPDRAVALLRRIDAEYGSTAAAEKARKRLAMIEAEGASPKEAVEDESRPEG